MQTSRSGARAYLDYNATAPLRPAALEALTECLREGGNPSSVHAEGRRARSSLERARAAVAGLVGAAPEEVVFTSGATEANALVLRGLPGPVLVGATEHASVLEALPEAVPIPVDGTGVVRLDALEHLLREHRPKLVALMAANNETGVIQPLRQAADLCHEAGAHLHVDAVQAAGRAPFTLAATGADSAALSAHKLGGPPGVGCLVVGERVALQPLWRGGGQEGRRRGGTENLPGIAGFAAAAVAETDWAVVGRLRERLEEGVRAIRPAVFIAGADTPRLPNTSCIVTPGIGSELQVISLDLDGVAVSAGAACSSGKVKRSHVLAAMGLSPELAASAIRVSLGWASVESDIDRFLEAYGRMTARVRSRRAA